MAPNLDLFNPWTGKKQAEIEVATQQTVDDAIEAAKEGQDEWYRGYSPADRAKILLKVAHVLEYDHSTVEEIAKMETRDTGRPIRETMIEAPGAADCLRWFAGLSTSVGGQHLDLPGNRGSFGYTRREPVGTCALIGAWNYPLQSVVWKSAPALAFGNSCVMKPSELTPSTALAMAGIYRDAGLPDGIFNVVLGTGKSVGTQLVEDPRIDKVSFTGSVSTGRLINESAASSFKKVTLEMGGKSPLIIFQDADLDQAVTAAMVANWYSTGQVCSNGTRVFVHSSLIERFLDRLVERTQKLKIGNPLNAATDIGPYISKEHMEKVQKYIRVGIEDDGATLLCGGPEQIAVDYVDCSGGYYLRPTIFTDCEDKMRIVREEIFGMVMAVAKFDTEEEVVHRANNLSFPRYGLSAGVFTQDLRRAHRVIAHLEAGTTWINNYNLAPVELPWGGYHDSGIGSENGLAGVESWTKLKSVYVEGTAIESPFSS